MKIKIPVKELEKEDIYSKVEETLMGDPENAYTVTGIMVETFKVDPNDVENKPFKLWKKGQPTLYGRIDRCLKRMVKEGKANCQKDGKAFVYWIKQQLEYKFAIGGRH